MRDINKAILTFPARGITVMSARMGQPEGTCVNAINVRPFDAPEERLRGGSRPGLTKYCPTQMEGGSRIQNINYSVDVEDLSPNSGFLFRRTIIAGAVCNGTVYKINATAATAANTTGAQSLNGSAPVIFSTELLGDIYYTDGKTYKVWDPATNQTSDWSPTAGSLPGDVGNTSAKLIAMWRSRIVLSGLQSDPHNWFMSKVGDPDDWDYSPTTVTETQAVQGGIGFTGKFGDKVTALIPYSDDVLLVGCDHTIWQIAGDPMAGGRIDLVTSQIGMAWGEAWCMSPESEVFFMSNHGDIYKIVPGSGPQSISGAAIDPELGSINMNTNTIKLLWDSERDGMHVFITPLTAGTATHWFWDARSPGWWKDQYANTNFNPVTAISFDGDLPRDRTVLIGSEDGYIRNINTSAHQDDGQAFTSHVTLGPLTAQGGYMPLLLQELQAILDLNSSSVKFEVLSGDTPEEALRSEANTFTGSNGTFTSGFSVTHQPRERGYFIYIKLGANAATTAWSLECLKAKTVSASPGSASGSAGRISVRGNTNQVVRANTTFSINTSRTSGGSTNTYKFKLPLVATGTYNFYIDWGDGGGLDHITTHNAACTTHTYATPGEYNLKIINNGTLQGWKFGNVGDKLKLQSLTSWGIMDFGTNASGAFYGCEDLQLSAGDNPIFTNTNQTTNFFRDCVSLANSNTMNVATWNTSTIVNSHSMFRDAVLTNSTGWESLDFSNATNMSFMFYNVTGANSVNCSNWDMSSATTLRNMFSFSDFNRDLNWTLGNVTTMQEIFLDCTSFNGAVSSLDMSSVTSLRSAFRGATSFNQPVNSWNTASLTDAFEAFRNCDAFNQTLAGWDIADVTNFISFMYLADGINTANYDATLIAWQAKTKKPNLTINMGGAQYTANSAASVARNTMENTDGWTINDGGPA